VKEFPIWVPYRGGHLAAVVTVPDTQPRGLVLLLSGVSLAEEIGSFPLFPQAAERLAAGGLATARLDYAGLGDSTSDTPTWSLSVIEPGIAQALAVLEIARRAVTVDRFATVASCFGTRVALHLTKRGECVGAVCLSSPVIEYGAWTQLRGSTHARRIVAFVRSHPLLRRAVLRPLRRAFAEKKASSLVTDALAELHHSRILFLYGESEVEDNYYRLEATRRLEAMSQGLSDSDRNRYRVRVLPTGRLTGFDLLPPSEQELILETVVEWIGESFSRVDGQAGSQNTVPMPARSEVAT
jgi:hypothetical protein